jgi:excisionase family DNA binding protein
MGHEHEHAAGRGAVKPLFLSVQDAARTLGLSVVSIYRLIAREKLVSAKAGRKTLVSMASIEAYAASLPRFVGTTGRSAA